VTAPLLGGVETGGTSVVCALGTGPDDLREHERFPTSTPEETLDRIVRWFAARERPAALGVGAFGPVDLDPASSLWGWVTTTPKAPWRDTPVASVLAERLEVPVAFDTDVNAAALGEHRWGAGRDLPSLCYLTVGTGIGAGLVVEGAPVHGLVHPEVGHLRVPHDRAHDPFGGVCPSHGDCWEGLASGPAIRERWGVPGEDLPPGHAAWDLEAEYLAHGILAIVTVASPHVVVAGGGVMGRPGLREAVAGNLEALMAGYLPLPPVVAPALGERSGVLGALALAERLTVPPPPRSG
jgi:fructokinase